MRLLAALFSFAVLLPSAAGAVTINFDTLPTDETYIDDGLLLESSNGSYAIGGCSDGLGQLGCLGDTFFTGALTFTFVNPGTTDQGTTDFFSILLCRGCGFRGTTAQVFDAFGVLMTVIDMNSPAGVPNRTYTYSAPGIGSIVVDFGTGDAVESLTFGDVVGEPAPVPEPASLLLVGGGVAAGLARRWRRRA